MTGRPAMSPAGLAAALRERRAFRDGHLAGTPVTPHNQSQEYRRWARGSAARVCSGAMLAAGFTGGVIGASGSSPFPQLGELDPAPAMALALPEASYIVYSYRTPVAWWLGPEVHGDQRIWWLGGLHGPAGPGGHPSVGAAGEWIEVGEACNREYGRFSRTTTGHQIRVHRALAAIGAAP